MSYVLPANPAVRRVPNNVNSLDSHELLKKQLARQDQDQLNGIGIERDMSFSGSSPANIATGPAIPVTENYGFDDTEVYCDSVYRDRTSDINSGEIIWNLTQINNNQEVSNIMEMRLGNFYFPKILVPVTAPEFFYFRKVYMEIVGTTSQQAVNGPNGQRFHFEFDVEDLNSQAVMLRPTKNWFYFATPINWFANLTCRFMVPQTQLGINTLKRIPIPEDTLVIRSLITGGFGYNPIRFQVLGLNTTSVLGLIGSLGVPGVAIFITNYNSNDPAVNVQVNNSLGIFATTVIDNTTFEVAGIDASTVTAQYQATMYVPKNRIAFPFRMTSIRSRVTNHMSAIHQ